MEYQVYFISLAIGQTSKKYKFQWLILIFNQYIKEKVRLGRDWRLFILNRYNSYFNIKFLDQYIKYKILIYIYPLHLMYQLQPFNISLFRPLTQYYLLELDNYIYKSFKRRGISKKEFFRLFWLAFKYIFTEKNIKSGWARMGIQLYNKSQVLN